MDSANLNNLGNNSWVTPDHIAPNTKFDVNKEGTLKVAPKTSFFGGMTRLFQKTYSATQLEKAPPAHISRAITSAQANKTDTIATMNKEGSKVLGQSSHQSQDAKEVQTGGGNLAQGAVRKAMSEAYDKQVRAVINNPAEALSKYKSFQDDDNKSTGEMRFKDSPCTIRQGQGATAVGTPLNGPGKLTQKAAGGDVELVECGNFKDDKLHGLGKRSNNNQVEEGLFKNGVFVSGKVTTKTDVYEGTFLKNGVLAKGTIQTPKKTTIVEEGKADGSFKGKITYKDGNILEGEFDSKEKLAKGTDSKRAFGGTLVRTMRGGEKIPTKLITGEGKTITLPPSEKPAAYYVDGPPKGYYQGNTNDSGTAQGEGTYTYIAEGKPYATHTETGTHKRGGLEGEATTVYYNADGKEVTADGTVKTEK